MEAGVAISFSTSDSTYVDANTLVVTREVDPNLIDYNGGSATGKVTVTLTDGTKKSFNGGLSYSPAKSSAITPATPGYQVYAFVVSDPSALQAFIDQYHQQAKDLDVFTKVELRDMAGDSTTTTVEAQEEHNSSSSYIGSVGMSVGDINQEYQN